MKIAVNTRSFAKNNSEYQNSFTKECFKIIAAQNPQHEFILISDKRFNDLISLKNITSLIIKTEIKTSIAWQFWHNYKLPAMLKKYKVDALVNMNGFCSLRTKIPQCFFLSDLSFLNYPQFISKKYLQFYKRSMPSSLTKAKSIVTISQSAKKEIINKYKIDEEKIDVVYSGLNKLFIPIDWKEKEAIKEAYSDGKEFFIYSGNIDPINNIITLLKAFSFFKKRQKSNMQLMIATTTSLESQKLSESLKTYKYKSDVKVLENLSQEELAKITASAYSFICPSLFENFSDILLQAMKCNVPVIAPDISVFHEICAGAALYADPDNFENIADKIMLLFKDEKKRDELIEKGKHQSLLYNWNKTASLLWQAIQKTVQL